MHRQPETIRPCSATVPFASGMRVAVVSRNADIRDELRRVITEDSSFVLVAAAHSWSACERDLEEYLPELLIADDESIPAEIDLSLATETFPVVLKINAGPDESRSSSGDGLSLETIETGWIRQALNRAAAEIYRRKAAELSTLVKNYLAGICVSGGYNTTLNIVENDSPIEIAIEAIIAFTACGNYVRVHTSRRFYEVRDTLSHVSSRLDPVAFVRIHRSHIVNCSHICGIAQKDGLSANVVLSDGIELPIGPSYRSEVISLVNQRLRLTA